ncbi:MAG: T9SS type A sorting domain-containing protein [Bacteroidales bacterium]|jgi:hypothetical protein|nr:T9SS type A sorting domain-containing protein [Bacteroidales bacterium]
MVKFITKTVCVAFVMALCVWNLNAQNVRKSSDQPQSVSVNALSFNTASVSASINPTRAIIYSEGFESTPGGGGALPTGWTVSATGKWKSYSDLAEVEMCGDDFSPHTGTKMMGNSWTNAGNNWAFTPGFPLVAGEVYTVTFWYNAMGYAPYSEPDNFEVRIGTDPTAGGMSGATLVFSQIGLYYYFDFIWRTTSFNFTPTTSGNYHLGFHDLRPANTGLALLIYDIEVTGGGTPPNSCPAVTNVTAALYEANKVKVNWTAPSETTNLTKYKIYQGGVEKGDVPAGTTNWTSDALANGTYKFEIEAIYNDDCIPVKVAAADITINMCDKKVTDLDVAYAEDCGTATITWIGPAKGRDYEGWIKWSNSDEVIGRVGWDASAGNDMTACLRFLPSDLTALGIVNGQKIDKIALGLGTELYAINTMEIRIWTGGTSITNPGTLDYTHVLTGSWGSYPENTIAEFDIEPFTIADVSKELRIGWNLVNTAGYPFGRDAGPTKPGKGMVFYCITPPVGGWIDAAAQYGWNYNWVMRARVVEGGDPPETKYNIYRGDVKIAGPIEEVSFDDKTFDKTLPYTWNVAVICSSGNDGEWVAKSKVACYTPPPCQPVTDVNATYNGETKDVAITWTAPAITPAKYGIYKGGEKIGEATTTEYKDDVAALEPGEYSYEYCILPIYAPDVCEGTPEKVCKKVDFTVLSIKNYITKFSIVPNPATNDITITAKIDFSKVEIVNFLGQIVLTQSNDSKKSEVDISNLTNGVYFVRIISENGTSVQKFIKQQ